MSVILDLVGALFVSASIMLTINHLMANLQRTVLAGHSAYTLQQNTVSITEVLAADLGRAGFRTTSPAVLAATDSTFSFAADVNNDGAVEVVSYFMASPGESGTDRTENPRDRPLVRIVNADTICMNIGMTHLSFAYLDSLGLGTAAAVDVRAVHLTAVIENTEPIDSQYCRISIDKIIYPRNL